MMNITKIGHCCMLIEEGGLRILTDPGYFSTAQDQVTSIDIVLITHEHQDHIHIPSLRTIIKNNPKVVVYTNKGVGKLLDAERIAYKLLLHHQSTDVRGVHIEGFGEHHIEIVAGIVPIADNTGYMIGRKLFYPGDAFTIPATPVEVLALPAAGPWTTIGMAIDYGRKVKPKIAFPVHDAMLNTTGFTNMLLEKGLAPIGTKVVIPELNTPFSV